jgi:alginate O-acetyltransferase complex protein AlgI
MPSLNIPAFSLPLTVASGVVADSFEIDCDFSGYSGIAIGVSRIIGFDLPENFNMPCLSTSITEFWRRWDMTLSTWLRDYLCIPLGGNRRGRFRTYFNPLMTMLIGGLWHGANWTFVIWGGRQGLALRSTQALDRDEQGSLHASVSLLGGYLCLRMLRVDLLSLTQFARLQL